MYDNFSFQLCLRLFSRPIFAYPKSRPFDDILAKEIFQTSVFQTRMSIRITIWVLKIGSWICPQNCWKKNHVEQEPEIVIQSLISCQSKDEESQWESRPLFLRMSKSELEGPKNHPQEEAVSLGHLLHSAGVVVFMGFLAAGHWTLFGNFGKEAGEHSYSSLKIYHSTKNKTETNKKKNKKKLNKKF